MRKIISIIIISIIIKGFICECQKEGGGCTGGIEGKTRCILEPGEGGAEGQCVEKTECELKENPSGENDCKDIPTLDGEKCVYQQGDPNKCIIKKICSTTLETSDCNDAITLTPEETKCQFNSERSACEEIDLCSIASSPSKTVCEAIKVLQKDKQKCVFDSSNTKCVIKTLCNQVTENFATNCPKAISLDPTKKCSFQEGGTACSFTDLKCVEILEGASNEICLSMTGTEGKFCKYDSTNKKCIETTETCKSVKNPSNEESCTILPTSNPITLKCIMKIEGTNKECDEEKKKCLEIKRGGTENICTNAPVSNEKYKCVLKDGACNEVEKEKETTEAKSSQKTEEKNGANYIRLSLGLLSLLLF